MVMEQLLANYRFVALLDTGAFSVGDVMGQIERIVRTFGLEQKVVPASTEYLRALIEGPWDGERFVVVEPYGTLGDFMVPDSRLAVGK